MTQDNQQLQKSDLPTNAVGRSDRALAEEATLAFWKENTIFEKTVAKDAPNGEYVFYEGPPTANAKPALHHLEARAFKDVIPRYKTMQGYHVPRRAGWDTHGLPVELQIEKKLGFISKKDIEEYGVAKFNKECKDSVFTYIKDWEDFTDRIGYWVDKKSAYYTFNTDYIQSLWNIVGKINDRGLLYKDYRVTPWCARCGTTLATHELAQGYMDVKDLSVTAKFKVVGQDNTFILAWTTTPWTLPGNVVLAVGKDIEYLKVVITSEAGINISKGDQILDSMMGQILFIAKERVSLLKDLSLGRVLGFDIIQEIKGSDLVGLEYEPLYPYLKTALEVKGESVENAFKVYAADFVTTSDGTGVVHIAPMYGADDFELATKVGLPKYHTVNESGRFIQGTDFLEGRFVKDEEVAIDIIKDLAHRGQLFKKEKYEHSYPHCWRCKTPLLYYARDSWYVRMSQLRDELIAANETINWEPDHIKEGRFGEWLREVKDWAFSRERYWGTPLPVWSTDDGERVVVDSVETLKSLTKPSGNNYFVMRHGESQHNVLNICSSDPEYPHHLTETGKEQVLVSSKVLKDKNITAVYCSPFMRSRETATLVCEQLGISTDKIVFDERIREFKFGDFHLKSFDEYLAYRNEHVDDMNLDMPGEGGETLQEAKNRFGDFIYEVESNHAGENILVVTHGIAMEVFPTIVAGMGQEESREFIRSKFKTTPGGGLHEMKLIPIPHNEQYELDLHKPYIDQVELYKDGKKLTRAKEVIDVWFDSGSMPFAQSHYPFSKELSYPADFISEAIDQTRGWFYTLLAVGVLMEKGAPYKNVICLGHLLDKDGKKMSKSIGNIVEPFEQMNKFGVDAVRWWMYSVNAPGESKNYDEKSVAEINNKVFNLFNNVLSFYELYRDTTVEAQPLQKSENVLDQWIVARLHQTVGEATAALDAYDLFKPTRTIRDFIDDLSTWYLRRSRDRIKDGDVDAKYTLYTVMKTTAKLMAPFAPFFAEYVWQKLKTSSDEESIHLAVWPESGGVNQELIASMLQARNFTTMGNARRKLKNIPIRQPLRRFLIKHSFEPIPYWEEIKLILADELNVKEVSLVSEGEVEGGYDFDWDINEELKLEGEYRELVRLIQDMRKEKGLTPQEEISLTLPEKYSEIVAAFGEDLKKTVGARDVSVKGQEIIIN